MELNKNITVILARKRVGNTVTAEEKPKLRVAAYCRVSTDSDEQASSYEVQVEHYTQFIQKNPEWELAGIFADDGISGCNTKKRSEFIRMIEEYMAGRIDMIITKSISRFARNTLDCLKYIRELKEKNIPVFFEKENINTMDSKGEVLLTIMASLAQQESQSLSQNIKLGLQYRYQNGEVQVNHNRFLRYTKDEDGYLIIEPTEAEVVKRIYREYLEGSSLLQIGRGLEADGILTAAGKVKWRPETLRKILQNEKYIGNALLQKTYTVDFLNKKRVQEEMVRRANLHSGEKRKKRVYSSKYALSSIVYCPKCGDIYRRIAWNNRGKHSIVWRCCTRVEHGPSTCDAPTIQESELQAAVVWAINLALGNRDSMIAALQENVETVIRQEDESSVEGIESKLEGLQKELLKWANSKKDYNGIAEEIYRLRDLKQNALVASAEREGLKKRIAEMREFLDSQRKSWSMMSSLCGD
jgi:site-specific DNA recombinase